MRIYTKQMTIGLVALLNLRKTDGWKLRSGARATDYEAAWPDLLKLEAKCFEFNVEGVKGVISGNVIEAVSISKNDIRLIMSLKMLDITADPEHHWKDRYDCNPFSLYLYETNAILYSGEYYDGECFFHKNKTLIFERMKKHNFLKKTVDKAKNELDTAERELKSFMDGIQIKI